MTLSELKSLKVGDTVIYEVPFPLIGEEPTRIETVTKAYGTPPKHTGEASAVEVVLETVRIGARNRFTITKVNK